MNTTDKEKLEIKSAPTTNQRLVTILLILLIILVGLLVIGVIASFLMMGGWMRGGMMSPMMRGYDTNYANSTPLTIEQAKAAAEKYLAKLANSDLEIAEVMIFDQNAYLIVKETSTGNGAFELLVDPGSQVAYPEYGPNMMWNLKYGCINHQQMMEQMMGGNRMMGGGMMGNCDTNNTTPPNVSVEMTVNAEQAIEFAQKYLDQNISGATVVHDPTNFYGYYTLDFEKDGKLAGMLSVNGYSGQVFLHTWHGKFLEESEMPE
jgi:hypothetical protein